MTIIIIIIIFSACSFTVESNFLLMGIGTRTLVLKIFHFNYAFSYVRLNILLMTFSSGSENFFLLLLLEKKN